MNSSINLIFFDDAISEYQLNKIPIRIGFEAMTYTAPEEENLTPVAHATIVFMGPAAPHWEFHKHFGEDKLLDDFWTRVKARLLLLPKHDPQFRRNRERVNRDAERERIVCSWDLGEDDAETSIQNPKAPEEVVEPSSETEESAESELEDTPEVEEETTKVEDAGSIDSEEETAESSEAEDSPDEETEE